MEQNNIMQVLDRTIDDEIDSINSKIDKLDNLTDDDKKVMIDKLNEDYKEDMKLKESEKSKESKEFKIPNRNGDTVLRDFTQDEIGEINSYITTHISQSILPQLFILSENPDNKIKVFITIYRIVTGVSEFVESQETKDKIKNYLSSAREAYNKIYPLFLSYDKEINTGRAKKERILIRYMLEHNDIINVFINNFLIFAERLELTHIDKTMGINLEKPEGRELNKKIMDSLIG